MFAPPSCIGVRTLHPSRHLTSVFAPCIFLVCLSDDRLRTSSLVRAVTFFVVQGMGFCSTTPGPSTRSRVVTVFWKPEKVQWIRLDVPSPRFFSRDADAIYADSGQQVTARIRNYQGEKRLMVKSRFRCDDAVLRAARQQAMDILAFNSAIDDAILRAARRQQRQ